MAEDDVSVHPAAAQRYMRFMGVVGPSAGSVLPGSLAHFTGRFRRSPGDVGRNAVLAAARAALAVG